MRPSPTPSRALKSLASFIVRPAVLVLFAFALLIGTPAPSAEGATVNILVGDFWFCSAGFQSGVCLTTVTLGDTVSWDFSPATFVHTSTDCAGNCGSPPFGSVWDSGFVAGNGPKFQHTFNSAGVFLYYCTLHPLFMRGQITVTGQAASYDLETTNGNIKGIDLAGPIRAKTRNGSINVEVDLPPDSTSTMETGIGDVNITLPVEVSVDVFGAVKIGRIEAPEFATIGEAGHEVKGVFNGGDAELYMQLKNGTIRLKIAP